MTFGEPVRSTLPWFHYNTDWHDIQGSDNLETDLETSTRLHLLTNLTNAKHVLTLFHKDWKIVFIDSINFDTW